jgi:hypothetical protein
MVVSRDRSGLVARWRRKTTTTTANDFAMSLIKFHHSLLLPLDETRGLVTKLCASGDWIGSDPI